MKIRTLLVLLLSIAPTQHALAESNVPRLFDEDSVLELTMTVNFDTLCRTSEDPNCNYTPSTIEYRDGAGSVRTMPIEIRRRGGWRARQTNCQVPTLFVRFSSEDAIGTPFEGQPTLALTSHCGKGISPHNIQSPTLPDEFEHYVITEYLGYRLYNLLTDLSLRARLVRITYMNPENPRRSFTHDAFFSEHFESLAQRQGAELLAGKSFDTNMLDLDAANQLALFQFMIGNTDWSIPDQNNIALLQGADGKLSPVLYDLDMAGLVNAHYARPSEGLPISSVTQRYYLGLCNPDTDWKALFDRFSGLREAFMTLLSKTPGLGRGDRRVAGVYLDTFFDTLDSPELRQRNIINACQPWPPAS